MMGMGVGGAFQVMTKAALTLAVMLASMLALSTRATRADNAVTLSLMIEQHRFVPAVVHAPAGKAIEFRVRNLGAAAAEFESGDLHVEKVIAAGSEAVVHVRPLAPGRYAFFDDFHHQTRGSLLVP